MFKTEEISPPNCLKPGRLKMLPADALSNDCAFSWHEGGMHFGFVDGSVHFISDTIEIDTYMNLGDRMDGEIVGDYQ